MYVIVPPDPEPAPPDPEPVPPDPEPVPPTPVIEPLPATYKDICYFNYLDKCQIQIQTIWLKQEAHD